MNRFLIAGAVACAGVGVSTWSNDAAAQANGDIQVAITNHGNSDFFLTPLWFGFHDGTFDLFDTGSAASVPLGGTELEDLAEDGIVGGLQAAFSAAHPNFQGVATGPAGFGSGAGQPPVIDPGETGLGFVTPANPAAYRWFSFASMVIPSNDTFIGNGDPLAYEVFDNAGNIVDPSGTVTIQIFGSDLYDSGTEVNDTLGAAFAVVANTPTDENGVVTAVTGSQLDNFAGIGTPAGVTVTDLLAPGELLATIEISVVPEPASAAALGTLGALTMLRRRRVA